MQYKLILQGPSRRTAVSRVVVHYRGQGLEVYLPVVMRYY
jgi:mannitol-specific phosphotransferase system IIBC component